jgi:DNA-binding CsgD family transcriptional regulator
MLEITNIFQKRVTKNRQLNNVHLNKSEYIFLLKEVVESLPDGILVLSSTGELLYANASAYEIFHQLNDDANFHLNLLPNSIWRLCQLLLEMRSLSNDKMIVLSDEVIVDKLNIFRIIVRWIDLKRFNCPCLLVTVENRNEEFKNVALAEAIKYDMTTREAEVWCLHRAQYSYKEIASALFISINTVKKHIKNIHIKQQAFDSN